MSPTRRPRRLGCAALIAVPALLLGGLLVWALASVPGGQSSVPRAAELVGTWALPSGATVRLRSGGSGDISAPAFERLVGQPLPQGQEACPFEWKVARRPAQDAKWLAMNFAAGTCGLNGPGSYGLYFVSSGQGGGELQLTDTAEDPPLADELYTRK